MNLELKNYFVQKFRQKACYLPIASHVMQFNKTHTVKSLSPLRLHTQLVTPNHWLVTQRMNMR